MPELSTLGPIIKTAYEAEANTNAFTDAYRAKLEALKTGDFVPLVQRGVANGVATLDASGKVPLSQLNVSGLQFKGAWNPNTNTPVLIDGTGNVGDFYKASHAGSYNTGNGSYTYAIGDWIIFAGGTWNRLGSADTVAMVNGKLGSVVLTAADVGALPDTYVPPNQVKAWDDITGKPAFTAAFVGAKPATYVPAWSEITGRPTLSYANRLPNRVANSWYQTGEYERIVCRHKLHGIVT